jgi:hypothetical protein
MSALPRRERVNGETGLQGGGDGKQSCAAKTLRTKSAARASSPNVNRAVMIVKFRIVAEMTDVAESVISDRSCDGPPDCRLCWENGRGRPRQKEDSDKTDIINHAVDRGLQGGATRAVNPTNMTCHTCQTE